MAKSNAPLNIKQLTNKARKDSLTLSKKMRKENLRIYVKSSDSLAKEIRKLKTKAAGTDKYALTIASKEKLRKDIQAQSKILRKEIDDLAKKGTTQSVALNAGKYTKYTGAFLKTTDAFDPKILKETLAKINNDLVQIQLLKTYGDNLKYSTRIWQSSKLFERNIRDVVAEGIARNRDMTTIAKDLETYVRTDRRTLAKRFANINQSPRLPGESLEDWKARVTTFKSRIPMNVEYNSLRIVRSQIQGAIQDSNIACQSYTPSVQSFDWTLSPAHKVYSICEDIEAANPWTYETFDFPTPPHPNCLSYVVFKEKPRKEFVSDLKRWTENPAASGVGYLNDWKANYYDPISQGAGINFFSRILGRSNRKDLPSTLEKGKVVLGETEKSIRGLAKERSVIFNNKGQILFEKEGTSNKIRFTRTELKKLPGSILTHNHPGTDSGFSKADGRFAVANNLREIRAVNSHSNYSLSPKKRWPSLATFDATIDDVSSQVSSLIDSTITSGEATQVFWDNNMNDIIYEHLSKKLGLNYKRSKVSG
ncbi:MAG: hypothetical protein GWN64_07900 [Candidatus Thorarchaeota archaeon]|nr:hypothetical protein [Candidatus Thorarchaeota archaeon]